MRLMLAVVVTALLLSPLAHAQTPSVRVGGVVDKLDGNAISVKSADGQIATVVLTPDAAVFGVEKRSLKDVKDGDYIASGGVKGTDGKIHAVELRIFPESLRGLGEGQRPWAVKTDGVMTNAMVGQVKLDPDGGVVHVAFKGGESDLAVGPETPIVAYVAGDRGLLKPGAAVVIFAQKKDDGTLTANRVTAEKDGVKPPN